MLYNDRDRSLGFRDRDLNSTTGPFLCATKQSDSSYSPLLEMPTCLFIANLISYSQIVLANATVSSRYATPLPIHPLGPILKGQKADWASATSSAVKLLVDSFGESLTSQRPGT